jgi:peptidoglycan/xylan/chitin deacetylase (PgdA/CDA1 family)
MVRVHGRASPGGQQECTYKILSFIDFFIRGRRIRSGMRESTKKLACFSLYYLGLSKIADLFSGGRGAIFYLHRVLPAEPPSGFAPNRPYAVAPETLRALIEYVLAAGYEVISLSEMRERLTGTGGRGKFVCLTFDDGYIDTLEHAQPVCAEFGVPMTVYIPTGLIDGSVAAWWYGLEALVAANDEVRFVCEGREARYDTATPAQKNAAYGELELVFRALPAGERDEMIAALESRYEVSFGGLSRAQFMDWGQLRELAGRGQVEIGAHTKSHTALNMLSDAAARDEVEDGWRILQERLGRPVTHFAYPYGDADTTCPRDFALCRELGFETATTTVPGVLRPEHGERLHSLPRLPIWNNEARATIAPKLSGAFELMLKLRGSKAA